MYILQEKPDAHDTYAPMTGRTRQPFTLNPTELDRFTAPEKKGSRHNPRPGRVIRGSRSSFSPFCQPLKQSAKAKHLLRSGYIGLLGPIYPACDQYVQYLIQSANYGSVLNRHGRGLPWRLGFATALSPPFPSRRILFPLISPSGLQLINFHHQH